ncbi:MAG: glycerol-3-phosphate acyltransferase [Eubacteriales bacterium]
MSFLRTPFFLWSFHIFGGFLLGSILFSRMIPQLVMKKDICAESADRNPGASNVFASCGIHWGFLCLALDMLKGFLPVRSALHWLPTDDLRFAAVMAAPVLGHACGIFNRFHGGKCIAASFGVMLALLTETPVGLFLAALYILFSTLVPVRPVTRRSVLTFTLFGLLSFFFLAYHSQMAMAIGSAAISMTAVWKHLRAPDSTVKVKKAQAVQEAHEEPDVLKHKTRFFRNR